MVLSKRLIYLMALVKLFIVLEVGAHSTAMLPLTTLKDGKIWSCNFLLFLLMKGTCLWIHGTGKLYPTYWLISMVHVGKVTRPMDPIGVS